MSCLKIDQEILVLQTLVFIKMNLNNVFNDEYKTVKTQPNKFHYFSKL